jgi:hypothetical protein
MRLVPVACAPTLTGRCRPLGALAAAWLAAACSKPAPPPLLTSDVTGTLTLDGAPATLVRCRPGHAVHVFVEVDTSLGTLRFGEGKLSWNGSEQVCSKLDRSWGGGVRRDGSAYFRGTLAFRCGRLLGDLSLDCGQISLDEGAELARNRAAATPAPAPPASANPAGANPAGANHAPGTPAPASSAPAGSDDSPQGRTPR